MLFAIKGKACSVINPVLETRAVTAALCSRVLHSAIRPRPRGSVAESELC